MLFHEMRHAIISISLLVIPKSIPQHSLGVLMNDYNFLRITTSSQLLRLNLGHNVRSGNASCYNFNYITTYTLIKSSRLAMGLKLYI